LIEKILKSEDIMKWYDILPEKVISEIESIIKILSDNYGTNRKLTDDGGYVCLVKNTEEVKYLKESIIKDLVEEYSDEIYKSENEAYSSTLYLLSTDYSVVIITKNEITYELLK